MNRTNAGTKSRLFREFAQFYLTEKCDWAPSNPRRVFNMAVEVLYKECRNKLSEEQVLAELYGVFGFAGADPPGLFQTFDPTRYRGRLRVEDHFINLFVRKLKRRLGRCARRFTDGGRRGRFGPDREQ